MQYSVLRRCPTGSEEGPISSLGSSYTVTPHSPIYTFLVPQTDTKLSQIAKTDFLSISIIKITTFHAPSCTNHTQRAIVISQVLTLLVNSTSFYKSIHNTLAAA
jgi:hypothetical protein